jgi:hypothetical protein
MINAIPIEPTSPAKHLALLLGLKLKIQNTSTPIIATMRNDDSINPSPFLILNSSFLILNFKLYN